MSAVDWAECNETQRCSHQTWVSRCSTQSTALPRNGWSSNVDTFSVGRGETVSTPLLRS